MFFYEKCDVFKAAMRLRRIASDLSNFRNSRTASDLEQLRRASSSVLLNIAEGAKERQRGKKLVRYDTARASAGECNAALLILQFELTAKAAQAMIDEGRELADRVSAMLTNLIRSTGGWKQEPSLSGAADEAAKKPEDADLIGEKNQKRRGDEGS